MNNTIFNIFNILNIVLMIQKMLFFLFITLASMCGIAYIWRLKLVREIRYYQGVNSKKFKK